MTYDDGQGERVQAKIAPASLLNPVPGLASVVGVARGPALE
jgi:hypothetical protein